MSFDGALAPRPTEVKSSLIFPPDDTEPEVSFFPLGSRQVQLDLLEAFLPHMDQILRRPEAKKRRDFQEYSITFALGSKKGRLPPGYNFRMRAFLQPMADGRIEITNWQLTVKTKGNGQDRREIETDDDLLSADLSQAFRALEEQYKENTGCKLPKALRNLDINDLYVSSLCLNARRGYNGLFKVFEDAAQSGTALVMVNSDDVVFAHPQILGCNGSLLITDCDGKIPTNATRSEAEIEIKNISWSEEVEKLRREIGDQALFERTLHRLQKHAATIFPSSYTYDTSKVDEAQNRINSHSRIWRKIVDERYLVPSDYLRDDMQPALRALMEKAKSPYEDYEQRVEENTRRIQAMRASGEVRSEIKGYDMCLLAA